MKMQKGKDEERRRNQQIYLGAARMEEERNLMDEEE